MLNIHIENSEGTYLYYVFVIGIEIYCGGVIRWE
jgi:hypothetical protein